MGRPSATTSASSISWVYDFGIERIMIVVRRLSVADATYSSNTFPLLSSETGDNGSGDKGQTDDVSLDSKEICEVCALRNWGREGESVKVRKVFFNSTMTDGIIDEELIQKNEC